MRGRRRVGNFLLSRAVIEVFKTRRQLRVRVRERRKLSNVSIIAETTLTS
jgi:hypothetical protein